MSKVYLYKNKLWKVIHDFVYTGEPQEFTLRPGKYLMICKGAMGGKGNPELPTEFVNYGGSAYGVLDLQDTTQMYAYVGGNGDNATKSHETSLGGYNGGGDGGEPYGSSYYYGAGGGGASDIRLSNDSTHYIRTKETHTLPSEYQAIEYIESSGPQYIDTLIVGNTPFTVTLDIQFLERSNRQLMGINTTNGCYFGVDTSYQYEMNNPIVGSDGRNRNTIIYHHPMSNQPAYLEYDGQTTKDGNYQGTSTQTFKLFSTGNSSYQVNARLWNSTIVNGDNELVRCFVPVKRISDNAIGLYDLVNEVYYVNKSSTAFIAGNDISTIPEIEIEKITDMGEKSLYTRIIVAGGGGGGWNNGNEESDHLSGFGGGVCGGFVVSSTSDPNSFKYASQTSGYSFGTGMQAPKKTTAANRGYNGSSGGGGGWYGGYSSSISGAETTSNGGGGSGYVLTASSYKPDIYFDGIEDDLSKYYFTDTTMTIGDSDIANVMVCELIKAPAEGDTIICPSLGEQQHFTLLTGQYKIKCWGSAGGTRVLYNKSGKGGYSEGILNNPSSTQAFIYVGGSGTYNASCRRISASYAETNYWLAGFNGGGVRSGNDSFKDYATVGGGASDVRLGTDSLLSRLIVAGGGGGMGKTTSVPGDGGGLSGTYQSSGSGINYGSGTQNSAGAGTETSISGGFGYGGNAMFLNNGYGGAGGGGWYGGSGTKPDSSSDDDKAGAGGSGYVLTDSSYKPTGYLLDERYYLTDTVLTTGGNTLPNGMTKIEIDVLSISSLLLLCKDSDGIKGYNVDTSSWEYISSETIPSVEDFETYGSYELLSDDGLLNNYEVYAYDQTNSGVNTMVMKVLPPHLKIKTSKNTQKSFSKMTIDADIDENNVQLSTNAKRVGFGDNSRIELEIDINMTDVPSRQTNVYSIQLQTNSNAVTYHEYKKKPELVKGYYLHQIEYDQSGVIISERSEFYEDQEMTIRINGETNKLYYDNITNNTYVFNVNTNKFDQHHIDLLPVGSGNSIPSAYRSYIGEFIGDNETITTTESCVSYAKDRTIYSAVLCNNSVIRFTKLTLSNNKVTIIKDVNKSLVGNISPGSLLVDDKYFYITSGNNGTSRILYRIPIDPVDITVNSYTAGNSTNYYFQSFGKMEWYKGTKIVLDCSNGFAIFDTESCTFDTMYFSSKYGARQDLAVGDKYALSFIRGTSQSCWMLDIENRQLYDFNTKTSNTFVNTASNCACYYGGNFYITQRNHLYIMNEETFEMQDIITPYTSLDPKSINYSNGLLYVTIENSNALFIYNIIENKWATTGLPFTINGWNANGLCRPTVLKGYFFAGNSKLYITTFSDYSKYAMGYKYNRMLFMTNSDEESEYEYDNRFVHFNDVGMIVDVGDIIIPTEEIDETNHISKANVNKSQYNKILNVKFIIDTEGGD